MTLLGEDPRLSLHLVVLTVFVFLPAEAAYRLLRALRVP